MPLPSHLIFTKIFIFELFCTDESCTIWPGICIHVNGNDFDFMLTLKCFMKWNNNSIINICTAEPVNIVEENMDKSKRKYYPFRSTLNNNEMFLKKTLLSYKISLYSQERIFRRTVILDKTLQRSNWVTYDEIWNVNYFLELYFASNSKPWLMIVITTANFQKSLHYFCILKEINSM